MDDIDRLMRSLDLSPPPDFTDRVMREVVMLQQTSPHQTTAKPGFWPVLRGLAWVGIGIPATAQVLMFIVGMWATTSAG